MKRHFFTLILLFVSILIYSQTLYVPGGNTNIGESQNTNIGINTSSPNGYLHIKGGSGSRGVFLDLNDNPGGGVSPMLLWDSRNGGADYLFFARQENNNLQFSRYTDIWSGGIGILTLQGESGNIGIGTTSPGAKLGISATGDGEALLRFNTDRPWTFYNIGTGSSSRLRLKSMNSGKSFEITNSDDNIVAHFYTSTDLASQKIYFIPDGGKVGIGTTEIGSHMLAVEGSIGAREIKVEAQGWSDFVFHPTYNLLPLQEVNTYIQQNGHLPEIPTAKEVEENGVSLGEMNAKLLQKIEELTLYVIELKKENEKQSENLDCQGKRINELEEIIKNYNKIYYK